MPQPTDLEHDPFLVLLTDALRAGPGSPEWRDAVAKLKADGEDIDEYRLLIEAREALENGKDYRSVKAGPGFTRKLMTNLEEESQPGPNRRPFPLAGFMAVLAGLVIFAILAVLAYEFVPRGHTTPSTRDGIAELQSTYFPTIVLSSDFASGIPSGWRTIGSLPVVAEKAGLRAREATVLKGEYIGGGIVAAEPLQPGQPFSAQVTLRVKSTGDDLIPQVFVSNSSDFSPDRAISQQELVWQVQGHQQTVVVGGRVEKQANLPAHVQTLSIRFVLDRDLAIVESDGHRLWAGANRLGDKPRYVGIRFVRKPGKSIGDVSVESAKIQKS